MPYSKIGLLLLVKEVSAAWMAAVKSTWRYLRRLLERAAIVLIHFKNVSWLGEERVVDCHPCSTGYLVTDWRYSVHHGYGDLVAGREFQYRV